MEHKIANLSKEQKEKLEKAESELGCVLVAYENRNQSKNTEFH